MNQKIKRLIIAIVVTAVVLISAYFILKRTGALDAFDSAEDIKNFILKGGVYSYLIFFFIQFAQVTIVPIPAFLTTVAGTLVFGPWQTTLISIVAQMLGAVVAFYIGRKLGRKIVSWIIGEEQTLKWQTQLGKGKYVFFLMMLFPFFPDDVLCMVAGLTDMSYRFFVVTNLITRPLAIVCTCYFGSGYLIPFSGYWLILWAFIVAAVITALILSFVYQEKIENFIAKLAQRFVKKKKTTKE
ncbi:MAG: VTT domain-containing protein [Clostridia bacterium]|nr:VTT domain-containing protein [Clostridia bacterium]